jgi:hypothetical protein
MDGEPDAAPSKPTADRFDIGSAGNLQDNNERE